MSAVAPRPTSVANSFYESDARPSFDASRPRESLGKNSGLIRAIGREREGLAPSYRPPSTWTQRSSHHDVVWTGEHDGTLDHPNDDQFSDAESWDGETQASSHAATIGEHDATTSVYGHARPTSIGSSIFAGRGAKSERRRREAPPPLPTLPRTAQHQHANLAFGPDAAGLLSPSAQSMLTPRSDASGFEDTSQYSPSVNQDPFEADELSHGFDLQNGHKRTRAPQPAAQNGHAEDQIATQPVPNRASSRAPPPLPVKAASRSSNESLHRDHSTSVDLTLTDGTLALPERSPARLSDGTLVPKMPPVPHTSDLMRPRKAKARRDRSPILSFDGGAAEEEKMLVELQDRLANDVRRISTLGPKVKKNAPAPWELGGDDAVTAAGRPSLRETLRPSAETFEKPFSRFKTRPSVDQAHSGGRSPNTAHAPSGLVHSSSNADSLEQEAKKEDDAQSLFATQRSRSKSVSSSAVGMLKGLGLAAAAAPASKKGKLTKALRLVGGGGSSANDERRPAYPVSGPFSEHPAGANVTASGAQHAPSLGFAKPQALGEMPHSRSSRTLNSNGPSAVPSKSTADLANIIMSANAKYRDQASSPPIPSPKHANGTLPSPLMGGARSLGYKKDTLSPIPGNSFLTEQGRGSGSLEQTRSRTPPSRDASSRQPSEASSDVVMALNSSIESEGAFASTVPEGESTPVGKAAAAEAFAARGAQGSPVGPNGGVLSASSSQTSGSLPLPGNIEGVPYKLISLEQAREQARQKQSEWLASSGAVGAGRNAAESMHDDHAMYRDPSSDGQTNSRILKNKKSGFLMRKLKKEKGVSIDLDGVSTFPPSGSSRDLNASAKSPMPSFSVTGLDEENDALGPLSLSEKPALQIRPVSSMFSGFAADFLDASALSEGHLREASNGSSTSSTGLLAPHSPAPSSFRTPSPVLSESGRFAPSTASHKPQLADIRPPPHGAKLPGPAVPGSADSTWSGNGGASGASRLPSLDAGGSVSDTQSQFHSPATSPLTPSFHHSVHPPSSNAATTPLLGSGEAETALSAPASPQIPEEVRQRAREIEAQIQELSNELHELRVKHVGHGTAPVFRPSEAADGERKEHPAVGACPSCGCGCAEQRRLQSINEAAVLKGISVLDRGRALKPSQNMGNTGKFGGYTNR